MEEKKDKEPERINEVHIRVRFGETDMAGMVHHSNYFHWFELGRFELLNSLFTDTNCMDNYFFPVTKCKACFINSAFFTQGVIVRTYLKKSLGTKLTLYYEVVDEEKPKKVIALGMTEHVCVFDKKKLVLKWPSSLTDQIRDVVEKYPYIFDGGERFEKKL